MLSWNCFFRHSLKPEHLSSNQELRRQWMLASSDTESASWKWQQEWWGHQMTIFCFGKVLEERMKDFASCWSQQTQDFQGKTDWNEHCQLRSKKCSHNEEGAGIVTNQHWLAEKLRHAWVSWLDLRRMGWLLNLIRWSQVLEGWPNKQSKWIDAGWEPKLLRWWSFWCRTWQWCWIACTHQTHINSQRRKKGMQKMAHSHNLCFGTNSICTLPFHTSLHFSFLVLDNECWWTDCGKWSWD